MALERDPGAARWQGAVLRLGHKNGPKFGFRRFLQAENRLPKMQEVVVLQRVLAGAG
jgi:hypothetical protein